MNSKFELVKCPLCKKNNYEVIINSQKKKEFTKSYIKNIFNSSSSVFDDQVVKCKNCKFIYLNPRIVIGFFLQLSKSKGSDLKQLKNYR